MQMISYVSDAVISPNCQHEDVQKLVLDAQHRNTSLGITGVLFLENGHFFQTIEGPRENLHELYSAIERDHRHTNLIKLADEPVSQRAFDGWHLDGFQIDHPELINPKMLAQLRALYYENIGTDVAGMIDFIKHMAEELDVYKIKSDLRNS